jgi:hypothetical protein
MSTAITSQAPSLNYDSVAKPYAHSTIQLNRIYADQGTSITGSASGGDIVRFKLWSGGQALCHNLDVLRFVSTPTATTHYAAQWVNNIMLQTIALNSQSGLSVESLVYLNYMMAMLGPYQTKFQDVQCSSSGSDGAGTIEIVPFTAHLQGNAATVGSRFNGTNNYAISAVYQEVQTAVLGGSGTATPVLTWNIQMRCLPPSIWTTPQAVKWQEPLELLITFANPAQLLIDVSSNDLTYSNMIAWAGTTIAYSSISYFLATEKNLEINNRLQDDVNKHGLVILKPHMVVNRIVTPTTTSVGYQVNYSSSMFAKLQRVWFSLFTGTNTIANSYNNSNVSGSAKITNFYTYINNVPTQTFMPLTLSTFDDYNVMKPMMRDSCIQDQSSFYFRWAYCDSFIGDGDGISLTMKGPINAGLSLREGDITYSMQATTASASYILFIIAQGLRELHITAQGTYFV